MIKVLLGHFKEFLNIFFMHLYMKFVRNSYEIIKKSVKEITCLSKDTIWEMSLENLRWDLPSSFSYDETNLEICLTRSRSSFE